MNLLSWILIIAIIILLVIMFGPSIIFAVVTAVIKAIINFFKRVIDFFVGLFHKA